jgi:hypothetical protein
VLRLSDKTQDLLKANEVVGGYAWPAGSRPPVPALLRWSYDRGAELELLEPTDAWALSFDSEPSVIHMRTSENDEITLLNATVRKTTFIDHVARLSAYTLVLGAHVGRDDRWPKAALSTANLSEWRADTGIHVSHQQHGPSRLRLDWHVPTVDEVALPNAKLRFSGSMHSAGASYAPDWSINTWQVMAVEPTQPLTITEFHRQFAEPLLAFTRSYRIALTVLRAKS